MARILGVGIATLDIVNTVERYPEEDAEVRATAQRVARGGNATNTLAVLAQLGHACAWCGTLGDDAGAQVVRHDLAGHQVDVRPCRNVPGGVTPTSYITVSRETGSRTIIHYRRLPELTYDDFAQVGLEGFDWLHFEARNVLETRRMMEWTRSRRPDLKVSLEVEKPRLEAEALFGLADVLLFSKDFATQRGFADAGVFLRGVATDWPDKTLVCAWGAAGARGVSAHGEHCVSPAFPPPRTVDTLGAGDVFNGAVIHGLLSGAPLEDTLVAACQLAGRKCGQEGLNGLLPSPEEPPVLPG